MPKVKCQISVADKSWRKEFPEFRKVITKCLTVLEPSLRATSGSAAIQTELSILPTNDAEIKLLNNNYREKNKPTNVLSFPQDEPGLLGDVVMSLETLQREAAEQGKSFHDHFCHLFIHGVLHLLGYDHENDKDQHEMESHEKNILHKLGIADPYNLVDKS